MKTFTVKTFTLRVDRTLGWAAVILCLFTIATLMGENMPDKSVSPVSCSIKHAADKPNTWIDITFSNITDSAVGVFERNLLKGPALTWSAFIVSRDGKDVPYTGMAIKRGPPEENEFFKLAPHQVVTNRINIAGDYDFSRAGVYKIKYFSVNPEHNGMPLFVITSNELTVDSR